MDFWKNFTMLMAQLSSIIVLLRLQIRLQIRHLRIPLLLNQLNTSLSNPSPPYPPLSNPFLSYQIPVVSLIKYYDTLLSTVSQTCPNIMFITKTKEWTYDFLSEFKPFNKSFILLEEYILKEYGLDIKNYSEMAIFWDNYRFIDPKKQPIFDKEKLKVLQDISEYYYFYKYFKNPEIARAGVTMLFAQFFKDLKDKNLTKTKTKIRNQASKILGDHTNKKLIIYGVDDILLTSLLVAFDFTSYNCKSVNQKLDLNSKTKYERPWKSHCMKWPSPGTQIFMSVYRRDDDDDPINLKNPLDSIGFSLVVINAGGTVEIDMIDNLSLSQSFNFMKKFKLSNFESFCGAEWLMGPRVMKLFTGLILLLIGASIILVIFILLIFCLYSKLKSLRQAGYEPCDTQEGEEVTQHVEGGEIEVKSGASLDQGIST